MRPILNHRLRAFTMAQTQVLEPIEPVRWRAGRVIYQQGEPVTHLIFVDTGWGLVRRNVVGHAPVAVWAFYGPTTILGLHAMLQRPESTYDYAALTEVTGWRIERDAMHDLMAVDTGFAQRLQVWVRWSHVGIAQVAACRAVHSLEQRLCRHLLMLRARAEGDRVDCPRRVLTEMVPMSRDSFHSLGRRLAGAVSFTRGGFEVHDAAALEARACGCFRDEWASWGKF